MDARIDERYEIGKCLASGGMADVYEARDRLLGRCVAIKRPKQLADVPKVRERFLREARVLAGFSHPNAVAIYDAGEDDAGPYIVMELVSGEPVSERLRREGSLPVDDASRIADRVLAALGAAHAVGIVHRDVKPANVILADDGAIKLADFGIAKMVEGNDPDLTTASHVIGTWRYLAPEVAAGAPASAESDLYCVGLLLREMLLGVDAADGPTFPDRDATVVLGDRTLVVPAGPTLPAALRAVLGHALATQPTDRFHDAASMRAALRQAVAVPPRRTPARGVAAVAGDPTPGPDHDAGTLSRWWPLAALLAALVAVALVLALVGVGGSGAGSTTPPSTAVTPPTTTPAPLTTVPPVSVAPTHAGPAAHGPATPPGKAKAH